MFRSVILLATLVALASSAPNPSPANVFEIDISPEEAQQYLNSPPFSEPQLSGRTAVLPLVRWNDPRFRTAEAGPTLGHYWKNGHEIENTDDYVEEVYDASQFHGQDGLGGFAYGYQAPESSKVENRVRSGDVTGSYTYKSGDDLIKVRYWADSEGFHQEDNRPKVALEPVKESEDVRQARLAHEKAWQEAAAAAAEQPDPQGEYDPARYEAEHEGSASAPVGVLASPQPASAEREGKAYAQAQSKYQAAPQYQQSYQKQQYQGQQNSYQGNQASVQRQQNAYQGNQASVQGQQNQGAQGQNLQAQQGQYQGQAHQGQYQRQQSSAQGQYQRQQSSAQGQYQGQRGEGDEEVEPTGPPRGFFYSYTYPVSIIEPKNAGQQGAQVNPGTPVDQDTVSVGRQGSYQG